MNLYSLSQVAKLINKSKQWAWILVISGRLKAEKVGNTYVVSEESLKNFQNNDQNNNNNQNGRK